MSSYITDRLVGVGMKRATVFFSASALILAGLTSCTGDTDGGSGADRAMDSDPFVDDGGAGGKLSLEIVDSDSLIGVGELTGFRVRVTDAQGAPHPFVRIACDTEHGISILEPAYKGISIESTDSDGQMSGQIGGLTPGSYQMECRAQNGFNLVDRKTIRVQGPVPAGFQGFPGAAGGHLGGGRVVDVTPDVDDSNGVRITSVAVSDVGTDSTSSGPLDLTRNGCYTTTASGSGSTATTTTTCVAEPFVFNRYTVNLRNDTNENVFVNTIEFRVGGRTVVSAQGTPIEVSKSGGTGALTGQLTTTVNCTADKCYNTGGTSNLTISPGTRNYQIIVTGTSESGNSFEISRNAAIQFDNVNNCSSGSTAGIECP